MAQTPHMGITLLEAAQAQKEVTANEAFIRIDALLNAGAISKDVVAPLPNPTHGDVYILPQNPTGAWIGKPYHISYFDQIWRFITPREGQSLWVHDSLAFYYYDGAAWVRVSDYGAPEMLGISATADATNRLSVKSEAVLFAAEQDNIRTIISKENASAAASIVFQTNYSGRAEFGLIGDDDFSLKLSADGSNFLPAFTAEHTTRNVTMHQQLDAPQSVYHHQDFISATAFLPPSVLGCNALALSPFGASEAEIAQLSFPDNITRYAQTSVRIPEYWNGGAITLIIVWGHQAAVAANVTWAVSLANYPEGGMLNAAYAAAAQTSSTVLPNIFAHSAEIALNHATLNAGDMLTIRIARLGADSNDTLAASALLFGAHLKYRCTGLERS